MKIRVDLIAIFPYSRHIVRRDFSAINFAARCLQKVWIHGCFWRTFWSGHSHFRMLVEFIWLDAPYLLVFVIPVRMLLQTFDFSWGSGANPWGTAKEEGQFQKPTHYDGLLEVRVIDCLCFAVDACSSQSRTNTFFLFGVNFSTFFMFLPHTFVNLC